MSLISPLPKGWTMSVSESDQIRRLLYDLSGIVIAQEKDSLIRSRLQRRLAATKQSSVAGYLRFLSGSNSGNEQQEFISSLTTNVTSFFREAHHFDTLCTETVPKLLKQRGKVDIWSAGCSSGEEPYSIAIALAERCPISRGHVSISGSDIDAESLKKG